MSGHMAWPTWNSKMINARMIEHYIPMGQSPLRPPTSNQLEPSQADLVDEYVLSFNTFHCTSGEHAISSCFNINTMYMYNQTINVPYMRLLPRIHTPVNWHWWNKANLLSFFSNCWCCSYTCGIKISALLLQLINPFLGIGNLSWYHKITLHFIPR
jgi:hypothetical protein